VARSRRPDLEVVRAHLIVAADRFDESGDKAVAQTFRSLLEPRGWELLKPATMSSGARNVALYMSGWVKNRLEERAREIGREREPETAPLTVLGEIVEEGWQKFLDGAYEPLPPVRAPRGKAPVRVNLNVRPSNELRERVQEACPAASDLLGWDVTPGKVAASYLFDEFDITDEDQLK
jgi:hypothetical protein